MKIPEWFKTLASFLLIALLLVAYLVTHAPKKGDDAPKVVPTVRTSQPAFTNPLVIGSTVVNVAIANTPESQAEGLSDTSPLAADQGMIFVFPGEARVSFWMKDMNYPLDIIWLDKDKHVVDMIENLDPSTYPKSYQPKAPAQYVLEVQAGFIQAHKVAIGFSATF